MLARVIYPIAWEVKGNGHATDIYKKIKIAVKPRSYRVIVDLKKVKTLLQSSSPLLFSQVLKYLNRNLDDLLIGKGSTNYDRFFQCIMEEDDFNSESILSDFEAATIKSINSLFPNVVHKGSEITLFQIIIQICLDRFFRLFISFRSMYLASSSKFGITEKISRR